MRTAPSSSSSVCGMLLSTIASAGRCFMLFRLLSLRRTGNNRITFKAPSVKTAVIITDRGKTHQISIHKTHTRSPSCSTVECYLFGRYDSLVPPRLFHLGITAKSAVSIEIPVWLVYPYRAGDSSFRGEAVMQVRIRLADIFLPSAHVPKCAAGIKTHRFHACRGNRIFGVSGNRNAE